MKRYLQYYVRKPPRRRITVGDKVQVVECSGLDSGVKATVIEQSSIPLKPSGVPDLPGYYKPMSPDEIALRKDDGTMLTMFANRLRLL